MTITSCRGCCRRAEPLAMLRALFLPPMLLLAAAATAPPPPSPAARTAWQFDRSDLTPDPRIRFGVLANGMRYAILPNDQPAGAVSVRLLVGVGATSGAAGEAHYLEHMAFMGSRGVPEGARARLSGREHLSEGMGFNAHTGDYDTYYRF